MIDGVSRMFHCTINNHLSLIHSSINSFIQPSIHPSINQSTVHPFMFQVSWCKCMANSSLTSLNSLAVTRTFLSKGNDDVIKWKHFPRYWPFVRGIHRSPANSPHKGQWRGSLMFTLICVWINGCVNNRKAGDLWRYCVHYGVTVMGWIPFTTD